MSATAAEAVPAGKLYTVITHLAMESPPELEPPPPPAPGVTLERRRAMADVVARLEERNLRQRKRDEQDRFADTADELGEEEHLGAVALNERLRLNLQQRAGARSIR